MACEEIKPREKPQKIPRAEKGKRVDNRREQDLSPTRLEARLFFHTYIRYSMLRGVAIFVLLLFGVSGAQIRPGRGMG